MLAVPSLYEFSLNLYIPVQKVIVFSFTQIIRSKCPKEREKEREKVA